MKEIISEITAEIIICLLLMLSFEKILYPPKEATAINAEIQLT
jgi:hypothetical protein